MKRILQIVLKDTQQKKIFKENYLKINVAESSSTCGVKSEELCEENVKNISRKSFWHEIF